MRRRVIGCLTLVLALAGLPGCEGDGGQTSGGTEAPATDGSWRSISVGMSGQEVQRVLGEPLETELTIKQTESIWGPQEDWWHRVALGDTLRTWSYEISGEGIFAVYFVSDSDTVSFTAFMPDGVVY